MLLHLTAFQAPRLARTVIPVVVGLIALNLSDSRAQGLLWSGVNEGGVIRLEAGTTATNLGITATPTMGANPTNMVFVLEHQGKLVLSSTSAPPYALTLTNLSHGKYFLTAKLPSSAALVLGDLSFDIYPATDRPDNDDWNQAAVIPTLEVAATGSNLNATREANEPVLRESDAGKSIWWAWTAASSGIVTATTAGSSFDTVLGVYAGTDLLSLVSIAANDDIGPNSFSQVTFSATNGVTYYFQVDIATGSYAGEARLRLLAAPPPSLAIAAPPDGYLMLVTSPAQATNVNAVITATDATGIASVSYWFDGGTNISRSGSLVAPHQLSLTHLFEGHYLLTVAASNNVGLVSVENAGFSIISLEPILMVERSATDRGKFQLGMTAFKGPGYSLQSSTNLDVWCGVRTWTNFQGAIKMADTNLAQFQRGFFRATSAP